MSFPCIQLLGFSGSKFTSSFNSGTHESTGYLQAVHHLSAPMLTICLLVALGIRSPQESEWGVAGFNKNAYPWSPHPLFWHLEAELPTPTGTTRGPFGLSVHPPSSPHERTHPSPTLHPHSASGPPVSCKAGLRGSAKPHLRCCLLVAA